MLVIELNTPGGLLTSTRDMVSLITESPLPVAVYVTPSGAHAASAGTFLLYAAHIAAMTEGTNTGAATPVDMGAPAPSSDPEKETEDKSNDEKLGQKALEDTKAFIRGLADMRGRNTVFAERAVDEAISLTASEALQENVIDYVASSTSDLLKQIDERSVTLKNGQKITLATKDAVVVYDTPDWRTRLLSIITDPNVAMILMSIGIYGLILEFYNPGTALPGTIGAICLILGLFAMNVLPINAAGIVFVLLGIALMIAEMFAPSFGILGLGGVAAFIFGGAILFDSDGMMGIGLDMSTLWGIAAFGLLIVVLSVWLTVTAYRRKASTGPESLIDSQAEIIEWSGTAGRVRVQGEIWQAESDTPLSLGTGDTVTVSAVDGLKLRVTKEPIH